MARTHWVRGPTTAAQGDSLHAQMCMDLILGNTLAAEEVASPDLPIILPAYVAPGAASGDTFVDGPYFVPICYDRDGMLRDLLVRLICASGTVAKKLWRVVATDVYREPVIDADTGDPSITQEIAVGGTVALQTEITLALPRHWRAIYPRSFYDLAGENPTQIQGVWLSVYVEDPVASTRYAGLRVRPEVDVS